MNALIISPDVDVVAELKNRLDLLGDTYSKAEDYIAATMLASANNFDLSIIDDEILFRPGGKTARTYTLAFVRWVSKLAKKIAILVMSKFTKAWQADFAISLRESYGAHAVRKPLDHQRNTEASLEYILDKIRNSGSLDTKLRDIRLESEGKKPIKVASNPDEISLSFGNEYVFVAGERLCSIDSCTAQALMLLSERLDNGNFRSLSGEELAKRLEIDSNNIRVAICRLRKNNNAFSKLLLSEKGKGYRLAKQVIIT